MKQSDSTLQSQSESILPTTILPTTDSNLAGQSELILPTTDSTLESQSQLILPTTLTTDSTLERQSESILPTTDSTLKSQSQLILSTIDSTLVKQSESILPTTETDSTLESQSESILPVVVESCTSILPTVHLQAETILPIPEFTLMTQRDIFKLESLNINDLEASEVLFEKIKEFNSLSVYEDDFNDKDEILLSRAIKSVYYKSIQFQNIPYQKIHLIKELLQSKHDYFEWDSIVTMNVLNCDQMMCLKIQGLFGAKKEQCKNENIRNILKTMYSRIRKQIERTLAEICSEFDQNKIKVFKIINLNQGTYVWVDKSQSASGDDLKYQMLYTPGEDFIAPIGIHQHNPCKIKKRKKSNSDQLEIEAETIEKLKEDILKEKEAALTQVNIGRAKITEETIKVNNYLKKIKLCENRLRSYEKKLQNFQKQLQCNISNDKEGGDEEKQITIDEN